MSGKLFHLTPTGVIELAGSRYPIERELQRLLEQHLEIFLGVTARARAARRHL